MSNIDILVNNLRPGQKLRFICTDGKTIWPSEDHEVVWADTRDLITKDSRSPINQHPWALKDITVYLTDWGFIRAFEDGTKHIYEYV